MMNKAQFAFDILFAFIMIAFIHFLILLFTPGPLVPEIRNILDWFTN